MTVTYARYFFFPEMSERLTELGDWCRILGIEAQIWNHPTGTLTCAIESHKRPVSLISHDPPTSLPEPADNLAAFLKHFSEFEAHEIHAMDCFARMNGGRVYRHEWREWMQPFSIMDVENRRAARVFYDAPETYAELILWTDDVAEEGEILWDDESPSALLAGEYDEDELEALGEVEWDEPSDAYALRFAWYEELAEDLVYDLARPLIPDFGLETLELGPLHELIEPWEDWDLDEFDYAMTRIELPSGCKTCKRSGVVATKTPCDPCGGEALLTCTKCAGRGRGLLLRCSACAGSGHIPCEGCGGEGGTWTKNACESCAGTGLSGAEVSSDVQARFAAHFQP